MLLPQAFADLSAGLLADEQVDQRDARFEAARVADRLLHRARAQAACDPWLLAEEQPEAPVDDVVVVDDQHADPVAARIDAVVTHRPPAPPGGPASGLH